MWRTLQALREALSAPVLYCLQVELILAELEEDGSCSTKFSAGWAQVRGTGPAGRSGTSLGLSL